MELFHQSKIIKSPLNYIGGKYKLLPQLLPLFPKHISTFVDLFAGGCNVGINVTAYNHIFNDNLTYLIDLYKKLVNEPLNSVLEYIENRILYYELSDENESGYLKLRQEYNSDNRNALDLFVLIAYSFNHQIRFNSKHEFNNPFGKKRSSYNDKMKSNLIDFIIRIKELKCNFQNEHFNLFKIQMLDQNSFIYCDPPYLITTGTYNDGKRGFDGWGLKEEVDLLRFLELVDNNGIRFGLSNVIQHKGKTNDTLISWISKNSYLKVNYLDHNYSNSNYQTLNRNKDASIEVLITNYGK